MKNKQEEYNPVYGYQDHHDKNAMKCRGKCTLKTETNLHKIF